MRLSCPIDRSLCWCWLSSRVLKTLSHLTNRWNQELAIAEALSKEENSRWWKAPIEPGTDDWWGRNYMRIRSVDVNSTSICIGRKSAKITKKRIPISSQRVDCYALKCRSMVKSPNLAKCSKPSWPCGQLQGACTAWKEKPLWSTGLLNSSAP